MTTNLGDHDRFLPRVGTVFRPTAASVVLLFSLVWSPPARCAPAAPADDGAKIEGLKVGVSF